MRRVVMSWTHAHARVRGTVQHAHDAGHLTHRAARPGRHRAARPAPAPATFGMIRPQMSESPYTDKPSLVFPGIFAPSFPCYVSCRLVTPRAQQKVVVTRRRPCNTAGRLYDPGMASDYFAEHGEDMVPVRLVDLACAVARMRQASQAPGFEAQDVVHERIFTCDLPRLEGYLPDEALREIGS